MQLNALQLKAPPMAFAEHERVLAVVRLVSNLEEHVVRLADGRGPVRSTWVVTVPEAVASDFAVVGYGGVKGEVESASQVVLAAPATRHPEFGSQHFYFHERVYVAVLNSFHLQPLHSGGGSALGKCVGAARAAAAA